MKFDSIIIFLLLIAFFVLPSILKQIRAGKKNSIFGRIGERIQQFVKDLENQARQQNQAGKDQGNVWDTLAEDEDLPQGFESMDEDADFNAPPAMTSPEKSVSGKSVLEKSVLEKVVLHAKRVQPGKEEIFTKKPIVQLSSSGRYRLKSNPLQNAVIWSEILSKPIALRDK